MNKDSKILIIGHNDFLENALYKYFQSQNYRNIFSSSHLKLNPTIQASIYDFFSNYRPEFVFLLPTQSGGIGINQKTPGDFIYHNLESQNNTFYASRKFGVKKLLFYAPTCIYPKECPQPMNEEHLLSGALEETSESYSIAKIAGLKLCQAFKKQYGFNAIGIVPAALYGPGCDTNEKTAHVMGALVGKFKKAIEEKKDEVAVWGSGTPLREFLYIDDFIESCLFLMEHYDGEEFINVGSDEEISIKELAEVIGDIAGFKGKITFDKTKPDGAKRKLLDSSRMNGLGWKAKVNLKEGIKATFESLTNN